MLTVEQLLQRKGHDAWTIAPDKSVYAALKVMAEKDIGALLVLDGEDLLGIFSERDYARKIILEGKSSMDTPVSAIMTPGLFTVSSDQNIQDCMQLMTDKHIRHLPVVDEGQLRGVISIGDVVKGIISEQAFHIDQLQNYIQGERAGAGEA